MCREMKWTLDQYLDQPEWFLNILHLLDHEENKKAERDAKKAKRK